MSSGFVPGGTADAPIERDAAWLAAQQELEATRRRKAEESRQSDGRSLYETLQANKAAKQDAFEEAARLKNQFRSLDADEVDFLDSVLERTRNEEAEIKAATKEGLETFRRRQEELDQKAKAAQAVGDGDVDVNEGGEAVSFVKGKRRRVKEKEGLKGVKLRRGSSTADVEDAKKNLAFEDKSKVTEDHDRGPTDLKVKEPENPKAKVAETKPAPLKSVLGLVDYGSDDDDD